MEKLLHLVIFTLDEQRYGIPLSSIERIFRVVEVTPLPKAPEIVQGIVNIQGRIIPVVNIRKRFRLPEKATDLSDQLILAKTVSRSVALIVDEVTGLIERPDHEIISAQKVLSGTEYVEGVIKLEDGMILIHDLDTFLSLDEEKELDDALKETGDE
jgi:purine-binding chemotaxis protein CheW